MKRLLNVDDGWLAGIQNCPPQGNRGGGVDEVLDLEAVARRWLGEPSVLTKEQHEGRVSMWAARVSVRQTDPMLRMLS